MRRSRERNAPIEVPDRELVLKVVGEAVETGELLGHVAAASSGRGNFWSSHSLPPGYTRMFSLYSRGPGMGARAGKDLTSIGSRRLGRQQVSPETLSKLGGDRADKRAPMRHRVV